MIIGVFCLVFSSSAELATLNFNERSDLVLYSYVVIPSQHFIKQFILTICYLNQQFLLSKLPAPVHHTLLSSAMVTNISFTANLYGYSSQACTARDAKEQHVIKPFILTIFYLNRQFLLSRLPDPVHVHYYHHYQLQR